MLSPRNALEHARRGRAGEVDRGSGPNRSARGAFPGVQAGSGAANSRIDRQTALLLDFGRPRRVLTAYPVAGNDDSAKRPDAVPHNSIRC